MSRIGTRSLFTALILPLWIGGAEPAVGQSSLTAAVGETADAATGVATGATASAAFTAFGGPGGVSSALGIPVGTRGGTLWGSATAWGDWRGLIGPVGITASGQGFGYRDAALGDGGSALSGRAEGVADLMVGPVALSIRGGGRAGVLASSAAVLRRLVWGFGGDATVTRGPGVLGVTAGLWAAPDDLYPRLAATGAIRWRGVLAHARVDRWLHQDLDATGWGLGLVIPVLDRFSLVVRAAQPTPDILFFSPPQRSWSVGIRYGTGVPAPAALPVPVFAEAGEVVRLEVESEGPGPVKVAGTFSDWQPIPMSRRDDQWMIELRLEPGVYEYTFVDPAGDWFVPEDTPGRKPDGFGGFVATVVVR